MTGNVYGEIVVGYHGCDFDVGTKVIEGAIEHLKPSRNPYDWLGDGIYFFEEDLLRARYFANASAEKPEKNLTATPIVHPYAIGAVLRLGNCLDLSRQSGIDEFREAYEALEGGREPDQELPKNKKASADDDDGILHNLDRAVINFLHGQRVIKGQVPYDTVRGFFHQGKAVFPTSAIGQLSHVQIAVRNTSCILGYFHPALPAADPFQGLNSALPLPYRNKR